MFLCDYWFICNLFDILQTNCIFINITTFRSLTLLPVMFKDLNAPLKKSFSSPFRSLPLNVWCYHMTESRYWKWPFFVLEMDESLIEQDQVNKLNARSIKATIVNGNDRLVMGYCPGTHLYRVFSRTTIWYFSVTS